jgi:osmotically-inducible protein OsmY
MKLNEERNDRRTAAEIANAIQRITTVPTESLRVTVNDDWVCLRGSLSKRHQKDVAEEVVRKLPGVRGVTNLIHLDSEAMSRT